MDLKKFLITEKKMAEKFMITASDTNARRRGEKHMIGYGKCDEDFKRLVHSATHHTLFYPDVIEVYDVNFIKRLKLYECDGDGTLQEIEFE
ncbi:TPA: hypothetical protein H1V30_002988 [Salmonella enterica]|nr:hypothetical protein [Salmonella enterica]